MSPIKVTTEPKLFKMSSKSNSIVTKPLNSDRVRPNSVLFDRLEDPTDMKCALDVFVPKKNIKKLVLKSKPSSPETDVESPEESPSISALHKIVQNIDDSGNINDENIPKSAYQSSCAQESRITPRSNLSTPEPLSVSFSSPRSGVILNRPDYHTQPSLNELESLYKPDTDSCMVDKFLIENHYGSILFEEPMDIKGLNLDEIVHIRKKEVVVYPDDSVKPPIGQGLNRPAIITLYQVWPTDKKNHETIKDVNRLKLMQYSETIEKATLRKGARFIDYRPQTGAWVFAVEHFSKYTLTEDDESIQPQPPLPQLAQLAQIPPSLPPSTVDSIEKFEDLDAMRDSIFNDEDLCVISPQKYKKPLPSHSAKRVARDSPINIRSLQVKFETKVNYPKIRSMKLKPDLFAAENRLLKDISSIKIAGTPKVRFLNGSRNFCVISGQSIIVQQLNLLDGQLIPKLGQYFTNHSSVIDFQMNPTLAPYIETEDYIDIAETHDLLHALYGDLKTDKAYAKQNERLLRVINYLSARNAEISVPNNVYKKIIYHWACNRYDLASFVAIESNHPRLALLITAANIDRDLMIEQLHVWRMSCADQYIEKDLLKIYVLLAGLTEWKLSDNRTIDCLKGLHWTQQLNLLLLNIKSLSTEPDKYGFHLLPKFLDMLDTDTNDVDFHILSRKKPCHILSAAPKMNIIEEWFLLESLKSFHILCTETEWSDSDILHCNMVAQLGAVDIKWACFVALHIINNEIRNGILIKCLEQNIGQINQEVETWLLEKLKIPKEFIDNAKILSASANWFSPLTSMQQG